MRGIRVVNCVVLWSAVVTTAAAQPSGSQGYDLVIRNGQVVDGTGRAAYLADVAVSGDRIAAIGELSGRAARRVIDAAGLVVAPGFIDPHSHTTGRIFDLPTAENLVRQGITTVVDGNDGRSPLPVGDFLERIAGHRISPNFALFVGHNTIRREVMQMANRAPTAHELERMKALIARAMEEGALGLSTGLAYAPGSYAGTEEVIELAKVAARYGGIYISHMRDEGAGVLGSVREIIRIGEEAGIPVQISHHKIAGERQFGQSAESLRLLQEAQRRGIEITFDQYPYTASSTGLSFLFPAWAHADGKLEDRLRDAAEREKVKREMLDFMHERFGEEPSRIQLVRCAFDSTLAGRTIADLLQIEGRPVTMAAAADVVIELQLRGNCGAIFHSYGEPDVEALLRSELGMIGSDGALTAFGDGSPHPRAYGTYPRVLGRYVRERRVLTLEEAVRKMTSLPADRLGFEDRGRIAVDMAADLVVFDPEIVNDRATFTDPHQYSVGVEYVIINGVVVIDRGVHTGARPGRVLYGPGTPRERAARR